jgi:SRSO17 transposase
LNAAFNVLIFVDQKFIKINDVKPISSQPKNKTNKLPPKTKIHMLIINKFINKKRRSTCGSYRKYENVYAITHKPIDNINETYVIDNLSIKISNVTAACPGK